MSKYLDSISLAIRDAGINANFIVRMQAKENSEMVVFGNQLVFDSNDQMLFIRSADSNYNTPEVIAISYDALCRILQG